MKTLLLIPPFTQFNTPYPSTSYLLQFLESHGLDVIQEDLGLIVIQKILSQKGLTDAWSRAQKNEKKWSTNFKEIWGYFQEAKSDYIKSIDSVIRFLQGKDDSLALRIASRRWLPEGPRFSALEDNQHWETSFGSMGTRDRAKYIASLYIDDIADFIKGMVDPDFQLSRYAEQLAASQISFDPLYSRLQSAEKSWIDELIVESTRELNLKYQPDLVGFSCPFPGNVYGALASAQCFRSLNPKIQIVMGGGYVNTELREVEDPRLFEFINYLTFDDGEIPLLRLIEFLSGRRSQAELVRTFWREVRPDGTSKVIQSTNRSLQVPFKTLEGPNFKGLPIADYISMMEMPNPMHRLWSDFKWNKMILAHGCYWKKCTFCDVSLDYISRFEPMAADAALLQMDRISNQTGINGFHFVDEAAPPAMLKSLSRKLVDEKRSYTWWGNLRFDKQFTPEVSELMAEAGCVAVTGGLEVASPRLLDLIQKGVTIEQVARVTRGFVDAGVIVHAYLMYGFPSQTIQESVDSLEVVRQLFKMKCLTSAFWHRFVVTEHSPVGRSPEAFGVTIEKVSRPSHGFFARNMVDFKDQVQTPHDTIGHSLRQALYNYMHGEGLDIPVHLWFDKKKTKVKFPKTTIEPNFIQKALS